ncbi:hypothetical protein Vretifemale_10508, partial [Volvox reticuliferus]
DVTQQIVLRIACGRSPHVAIDGVHTFIKAVERGIRLGCYRQRGADPGSQLGQPNPNIRRPLLPLVRPGFTGGGDSNFLTASVTARPASLAAPELAAAAAVTATVVALAVEGAALTAVAAAACAIDACELAQTFGIAARRDRGRW